MSWSRFSALFITLFITVLSYAQPQWQKGTRLAALSANSSLDGLGGGITNAGFSSSVGTSIFFNEKIALAVDGKYRWAPLSQSMEASWRLQNRILGAPEFKHSIIMDVHGTLGQNMNTTLSGEMFGRRMSAWGVGAQYTYWFSSSVGLYVWPQLNRTNGGPSGLWDWQMIAPVGLQLSWQRKEK